MYNTAVVAMPTPYTVIQGTQQSFNTNLFDRFKDYIDRKETTTKGYTTCIKQFLIWLENNGIYQPTREDIKAYRDFLAHSNLKPGTQSQYLRVVKQFFKWTSCEGLYPNIADNIHGAKVRNDVHKRDAFEGEDIIKILGSIDATDETGKRLFAMFLLCIESGLRTIEISRADVGDIKIISGKTYIYIQGKGHDEKDAPILLKGRVKEAIEDYLQSRSDSPTAKSPLFASTSNRSKGKRIAPTTISTMFKKLFISAGYDSDRLTAHSLRHTTATILNKNGMSLYETQQLMRHQDPKTTEIYIHADNKQEIEEKGRTILDNYLFNGGEAVEILPELITEIEKLNITEQKELLNHLKERSIQHG